MNRRRTLRNSLTLVLGQGLAQLASAVTFIVLARNLGIEQFGTLATLYGVALFLSIVVEFGAGSYATRELSVARSNWRFPGQYRTRQLMTASVVVAAGILLIILPASAELLLTVAVGFLTAQTRFLGSPIRAALHMGRLAAISALEKIATLVMVLVLASLGQLTTTWFFQATAAAALAACMVLRASYSPRFSASLRNKKTKKFMNPFLGLRHLGLGSLAVGIQSLDSAAVALTAGPFAAGVYAAVGRWTQPLGLVTQAVTQSAYAEMAGMRRHADALASLRVNLGLLSLTSVPLVVVFIFADSLTLLLLGDEYTASSAVLRVLIGAVLFGVINSPLSALLQARGDEAFVSKIFVVAMPLQLSSMCFLAFLGGAFFGSLAVLLVQALLALILIFRVRQLLSFERLNARVDLVTPAVFPVNTES